MRLRNELKQKAVAKECAEWMRRKVRFKSNTTREGMNNLFLFCTLDNREENFSSQYFLVSLFGFYFRRQDKVSIVFCSSLSPPNHFAFCFFQNYSIYKYCCKKDNN